MTIDQTNGSITPVCSPLLGGSTGFLDIGDFETSSCEDGKARKLQFRYTGDPCSATDNTQSGDSCSPSPGSALAGTVEIVVSGKPNKFFTASPVDEIMEVGDLVMVETAGKKRFLPSSMKFEIKQGGDVLQTVEIHTSCSQPLIVGEQFGSSILDEFVPAPKKKK